MKWNFDDATFDHAVASFLRLDLTPRRESTLIWSGEAAEHVAKPTAAQELAALVEQRYCSENRSINSRNHEHPVMAIVQPIFIAARVSAALMITRSPGRLEAESRGL
jgi:hypothetical protein